MANLFALTIDEGAGEYNALELSEEFEILGGSFSVSCNHDNVFFSLRTLSEYFERSLELLGMVLTKPQFNESDFQRERRKVEVKLLQQKDDPEELAELAFEKIIFGNHNAYSFPGSRVEETISRVEHRRCKSVLSKSLQPGVILPNCLLEIYRKKILSVYLRNNWRLAE